MRETNRRTVVTRAIWSLLPLLLIASPAQASIFKGEALDTVADIIAWVVLVVAPIIAIALFWIVHILPEKIAEKKLHPQTRAIQCLCLMSLVFGGILWPLAWIWAYTKPVMHKLAYGTDIDETVGHGHGGGGGKKDGKAIAGRAAEAEAAALRGRISELEKRLAQVSGSNGGEA